MKILFVGVFSVPWSTNHQMIKALEKLNHEVVKFDYRQIAFNNLLFKNTIYSNLIKKKFDIIITNRHYLPNIIRNLKFFLFGNWKMNKQLLNFIKNNNFDLIFLSKTDTLNYNNISKINKYSKTWYYFMDPLYISNKMRAIKYSKVSTYSSASTKANQWLFRKVNKKSYYITQGVNLTEFKPSKENMYKDIDVLFVGTNNAKRRFYINYLLNNNINVECYGKGWNNGPVYLENLINKYRISKIILNFHREDSGFSIRVFQALGTGSFLLSEYCSDLEKIFKRGAHLDWFKNPQECLKLIKYYLKEDMKREEIANNGYNLVSNQYTWEKIMEKIIQIIKQNTN